MSRNRSLLLAAVAFLALVPAALVPAVPARAAPTIVPVSGAGSTWSANAIDQWRRDVQKSGIQVNFAATGSSDGRSQFSLGTTDFGVSEIPYGQPDAFTNGDAPPARKYAYMPIVAGGTAFMYNLKIGGKRVTNLRLSGETIAKIFNGDIKKWDDPAIKADNPGLVLPARTVVPVVRSDGSGTTAQFTLWLSKEQPALWNKVCQKIGRPIPCGQTSYFPTNMTGFVKQAGSNGVAGYVSQDNADGTITYVEYSYAINARFPVVKVLNRAGYYVEPTASNVAVGLLGAKINQDVNSPLYLTQQLDGVYRHEDRRAYPLSSYSYMIVPTRLENGFTENKGHTLGLFAYHFLCEGQQQADLLGYSPLPINLVQAGIAQVEKIPGVAAQNITIAKCNNPTFSRDGTNTLAANAPNPSECDKKGVTQCSTGTGGARTDTSTTGGGGPTNAGPGASASATPSGSAVVDPDTGEVVGAAPGGGGGGQDVAAVPVSLDGRSGWGLRQTMMILSGLMLAGLIAGPPLVSRALRGRSRRGTDEL